MIVSRARRIARSTDCSASRLCGGRRSIIGLQGSRVVVTTDCHAARARREPVYQRLRALTALRRWTGCGQPRMGCGPSAGALVLGRRRPSGGWGSVWPGRDADLVAGAVGEDPAAGGIPLLDDLAAGSQRRGEPPLALLPP